MFLFFELSGLETIHLYHLKLRHLFFFFFFPLSVEDINEHMIDMIKLNIYYNTLPWQFVTILHIGSFGGEFI